MQRKRITREDIYDSLCDDELFAELPRLICAAAGARAGAIGWIYNDGRQCLLAHSGHFTDAQIDEYVTQFSAIDPWAEATIANWAPNKVVSCAQWVPARRYEMSILYNEYFRSRGDDTFWCAGVPMGNRWGKGMITLHRGRSQGDFEPDALEALGEHARNLARVTQVRARIGALDHKLRASRDMLDFVGFAAILVDGRGQVAQANGQAEALLAGAGLLRQVKGRIEARGPRAPGFRDALRRALDPSGPEASAVLLVAEGQPELALTCLPVRTGGTRYALLLAQPLVTRDESLQQRLKGLFGLSEAEAMVARMLADGMAPSDIAAARRVGIETVRAQIKSVAEKVGCTRQTQIAGIIRGLVPLAAAGEHLFGR